MRESTGKWVEKAIKDLKIAENRGTMNMLVTSRNNPLKNF